MPRRAARFTQAEVSRMARAAAALGPAWRVVAIDGRLELVQGDAPKPQPERKPDLAPADKWRL